MLDIKFPKGINWKVYNTKDLLYMLDEDSKSRMKY